jgi:hypothetical protein
LELLYITRMQLALKLKEPNALNFFNIRRSKVCVPHYEHITIPYTYNIEESLNKWVKHNLKGRYFVVKTLNINSTNSQIENAIRIGFEEGKELAYFMLACPLLKYK